MKMTELDHLSCFAASIYIFIGFVSEKDYFIWVFSLWWMQTLYPRRIWRLFLIFCKSKVLQKFHVRGICPFKTLLAKCHVLLQCSNLLVMPCDMPLKVMHTTYCHRAKGPCEVKERQLKAGREIRGRQMERKTGHLMHIHSNVHPLTRAFKVTKMKKRNHNLEVPLFPSPWLTPPSLLISLFFFPSFSFCLFHSPLPVSSPWSGGRQRVSALTQRSLQELLWLAVLCSTVHNRLRHGELPLTAFLCCSCGFDTVT